MTLRILIGFAAVLSFVGGFGLSDYIHFALQLALSMVGGLLVGYLATSGVNQ